MKYNIKLRAVTIGRAHINYNSLRQWVLSDCRCEWLHKNGVELINQLQKYDFEPFKDKYGKRGNYFSAHDVYSWLFSDKRPWDTRSVEACYNSMREWHNEQLPKLEKRLKYMEEFEIPINLLVKDIIIDGIEFLVVECGNYIFCLPHISDIVSFTVFKDYSGTDYKLLREIKNATGRLPGEQDEQINEALSVNAMTNLKTEVQNQQDTYESELKSIEERYAEELAKLEAHKQKLLAELEEKKSKLDIMKKELEEKLFFLETEIYAIRCYTGEVVNFVQLRKGQPAAKEEPLVMYQKFRFLDEEMGKICAFYDIEFGEEEYFERLIKHRDDVFTTFLPARKSVAIVRLTKNNTRFFYSEKYSDMLDAYSDMHGGEIGILIRDGDNLYITWTDDSKIDVQDDMFYVPGGKTYYDEKDAAQTKSTSKNEAASRYFVFNILLGALKPYDKTKPLFEIPEGANIMQPSEHVIYSTGDGWLEDNRFGTLGDMIDKVNAHIKIGDNILTVQNVSPNSSTWGHSRRNEAWCNSRGRGDRNITHDVSIRDFTIYEINTKDNEGSYASYPNGKMTTSHQWIDGKDVEVKSPDYWDYSFGNNDTKETMIERVRKSVERNGQNFDELKIDWKMQTNYYVSLLKYQSDYIYNGGRYTERKREARANFRVEEDEYINIELMNSVWIKYLITNRKIGNEIIAGQRVNFAFFVRYLNKMLDHVKQREAKEAELISQHINLDNYTEWEVALTEYKIETDHHKIGPRYAKQFAEWLKNRN